MPVGIHHLPQKIGPGDGILSTVTEMLTDIRAGTRGSPDLLLPEAGGGAGKNHTGKMLSQFLEVWEAVIETHTTAYPQACLVIRVSLAAMDCSSVVESGWSTANFLKGLHKTSTSATLLDDFADDTPKRPSPREVGPP